MKKYSTLLFSSAALLASLASAPHILAQESSSTSEVSQSTVETQASLDSSEKQKIFSTQQTDTTLSLFYQRGADESAKTIQYAIWSNENGQDDLKWYTASDYQTDIPLSTFAAGQYSVQAFLTVGEKQTLLASDTFSVTANQPTITTNISEPGFLDISIQHIPQTMTDILVPVWSNDNGQDDLKWYSADKQTDGQFHVRVPLKNHHFKTGNYSIHLYAREAVQGKSICLSGTEITIGKQDIPTNQTPTISVENIEANKGKYLVTVRETETSKPIKSVQVATWSADKQSNLKWRTANLQQDTYQVAVDFQEQKNHTGNYHNHVYITYADGSRVGYVAQTVDLSNARVPVQLSTSLASISNMNVTISNVYTTGTVNYAVWSDENGQDDLKWYTASKSADKTYTGTIPLSQHSGVGKYHIHVYQGKVGLGAFTMQVTADQRYTLTPNTYPTGECTWGAKETAPWVGNYWGNGGQWTESARKAGFRIGSVPTVGAVAVWSNGSFGHVAVVTAVESPTRIRVKEANYAGKRYVGDFRGWFNPVADGVTAYIYPN